MNYHDNELPAFADQITPTSPFIYEGPLEACQSMYRMWTKMKSNAALASVIADGDPADPLYGLGVYHDHRLSIVENERSQRYNFVVELARDAEGKPITIPTAQMALLRGIVQPISAPVSTQHLHVLRSRMIKDKRTTPELKQLLQATCIRSMGPKLTRVDPGRIYFREPVDNPGPGVHNNTIETDPA